MEWNLLKVTQVYSISSKILLFLQSDPLITPYGVIIFYSVYGFLYFLLCLVGIWVKSPNINHRSMYIMSKGNGQKPAGNIGHPWVHAAMGDNAYNDICMITHTTTYVW